MWKFKQDKVVSPPDPQVAIDIAVADIHQAYGIIGQQRIDHFTKNRIVETTINRGEIGFIVEFPPDPNALPVIKVAPCTSSTLLPGLERLAAAGLLKDDGAFDYRELFYFSPNMRVSNLLFIISVIIRSAQMLAKTMASDSGAGFQPAAVPHDSAQMLTSRREVAA